MPYYFADIEAGPMHHTGRGTRQPVGIDNASQRNWIYFGERVVLWTLDPVNVPGLVKIADHADETLSGVARAQFAQLASDGRAFRGTDRLVEALIGCVLVPDGNKWRASRPSKARSRHELILGPDRLLWTQFAQPQKNSVTYTDNFNRTAGLDGSAYSGGTVLWDLLYNTDASTNGTQLSMTNEGHLAGDTDVDTDDMYCQIVFVSGSGGAFWLVNNQNNVYPGSGSNGREFAVQATSAQFYAIQSGGFNLLDNQSHTRSGGTYKIESDGSSHICSRNGATVCSATDSSEPTGAGNRRAGIGSGGPDFLFDSWEYADIVAGGGGGPMNGRRSLLGVGF